jgi:hypothetical protein
MLTIGPKSRLLYQYPQLRYTNATAIANHFDIVLRLFDHDDLDDLEEPGKRIFMFDTGRFSCHQLVLWCSWLSLLSNTQAVLSSSLSGIIVFVFFFVLPAIYN